MSCQLEVDDLEQRAIDFRAETGLGFSHIVVINESATGNPASAQNASDYVTQLELEGFPVTADPDKTAVAATPWDDGARPFKCVLTPEMVMLHCWYGHSDEEGFDAIRQHAGL